MPDATPPAIEPAAPRCERCRRPLVNIQQPGTRFEGPFCLNCDPVAAVRLEAGDPYPSPIGDPREVLKP